MRGDAGLFERGGEHYQPYVGHLSADVLLLNDGSQMAIARLPGLPFELEEPDVRNAREQRLNTLLRNISDDNVTIFVYLVRHGRVPVQAPANFRSNFARDLDAAYGASIADRLKINEWFLTVVVAPRTPPSIRKMLRRRPRTPSVNNEVGRQLEDTMSVVMQTLTDYKPERLGLRESNGFTFTEIGEALRLVRTGYWQAVPLVSGSLAGSIYTEQVICGRRGFEIVAPGRKRLGAMLSFKEYPAVTKPGMLNELLSSPHDIVMTNSFNPHTRARTQYLLGLQQTRMLNAQDKAVTQIAGLTDAMDDVASNVTVMGSHHFSVAVYGRTMGELNAAISDTIARLTNAGASIVPEGRGMEAAYWSQLPGNVEWRTRPGSISARNFAGLCSLENFPPGQADGHWGAAIARFRTTGGTAYDYAPHVADVGMTAIFGPIGSGKTTLLMLLLAMFEKAQVGTNGCVAFFDQKRGGELLTRAVGGRYLVIRRGEASGVAPLRGLSDTPAARDFLQTWVSGLIRSNGYAELTPDEDRRLARGIARQLAMRPEMRSLAGLREFLGHADAKGAGAHLERWCRGNALGWAFDSEDDHVRLDAAMVGFDLTEVLEHADVCAPMSAYLLHRVESMVDGRRFVMSCDEFRAYLLNPLFAAVVDKFLLKIRSKNGLLILATQQPEHVINDPIGASLVAQVQTKIMFHSPTADEGAYLNGLKCTAGEYRQVRIDMAVGTRRFLLKRESGSVVCEFDLSTMPQMVAVLSGRDNTAKLADRIRRECGEDPAAWLPEFQRRFREARD